MNERPLIIGHRGASAVAPENTLIAFERALQDGADGIEFDVRLARDGVPVVIHDADLRRTALRAGSIASLSSIELCQVDAGTWFNLRYPSAARAEYSKATVPTLAQVLELLRESDALLYLEMKCEAGEGGALPARVLRSIREHAMADRVIVESFALDSIEEIKRMDSGIRTAALFERKLSRPVPSGRKMLERAVRCGADEIALHHTLATRRITTEAAQRGLRTVVWTVDSPSWVRRAMMYGVHALITNNPALFLCA
ncbi:MAG TPA: glycerophosphodiester phosphodiesterase family protein [Pyrinomonadaceae bacterium]|nr:glycerophosphodiester phosphodiesterase family protein [Pyrinomonadaceae bacterium]